MQSTIEFGRLMFYTDSFLSFAERECSKRRHRDRAVPVHSQAAGERDMPTLAEGGAGVRHHSAQ